MAVSTSSVDSWIQQGSPMVLMGTPSMFVMVREWRPSGCAATIAAWLFLMYAGLLPPAIPSVGWVLGVLTVPSLVVLTVDMVSPRSVIGHPCVEQAPSFSAGLRRFQGSPWRRPFRRGTAPPPHGRPARPAPPSSA